MATTPRRPTSLQASCNRALKLRNEILALARNGMRIPLTTGAVVSLVKNAEELRVLIGVQEEELLTPAVSTGPALPVDEVALPDDWVVRLHDLADREPNPATRRVVRSKTRYARWNLGFAASIAVLECTLGRLVVPSEPQVAPDPVRGAGDRQRGRGTASRKSRVHRRAETDATAPAKTGAAAQGGVADRTGTDLDRPTVGAVRPASSNMEASSVEPSAPDPSGTPARRPVPPPGDPSDSTGPDVEGAPATRSTTGGEVPASDRGRETSEAALDPTGFGSAKRGPVGTAEAPGQELMGADESKAASPAGSEAEGIEGVREDGARKEGTGRVRFDAPPGEGLARTADGTEFFYDAKVDAWMDETDAQHAERVARSIEHLLDAAPTSVSEPWHPFLSVPASLETSRLLATTILGGYTQIIGREIDPMQFEISPAAPLERLELRRMLEKTILVLWEDTPWYNKVMAEETSEAIQVGTGLWQTIRSNHRDFDKSLASWIDVEVDGTATTGPENGDGDDEPGCVIDTETGDPRSRFADVAAAIGAKSLPHPQRVRGDLSDWDWNKSPLPRRASVLMLGIGGSGKTHMMNLELKWLRERYPNTQVFSLNASRAGAEKKAFTTILREMAIAEAEGAFCIFVCDEVQHLSATDLERLGTCAAVVLAGDIRQSGSRERVHPVIAFARRTEAAVIDMTQVWRASNTSLLNQISHVFYDSAFSALGRGDGVFEAPVFKYDLCTDDAEIIAARCWAVARTLRATGRTLMLVIERDDIRDMLIRMAGSDKRQWTKGSGFVSLLRPSQIQGREADVLMFLPADFMRPDGDPASTARRFLTLMGRARQEIWMLFTRASVPKTQSERVFDSLLRSFLETSVTAAGFPSKAKLDPSDERFLADLGLTAHPMGRWQLLAYRGRAVALYEDYRTAWANGTNPELHAFAKLQGWPVMSVSTDKNRIRTLHSALGAEKTLDEIQKRKANVDRQLASVRK